MSDRLDSKLAPFEENYYDSLLSMFHAILTAEGGSGDV